MNEGINSGSNPKENKRQLQPGDAERLADYLARNTKAVVVPEHLRECGPEVAELEAEIVAFRSKHSLEKLNSIIDISPDLAITFEFADDISSEKRIASAVKSFEKFNPEYVEVYKKKIADVRAIVLSSGEKEKFEIRMAARRDIVPIMLKLSVLIKETNISPEKHQELKEQCKLLQKAIGGINKGKVNHT
ncbi:MAG: hypothetical protein V4699_03125 [Patescibacteria group bacterium]